MVGEKYMSGANVASSGKSEKRKPAAKNNKPKKSAKLNSSAWYQRAAAEMSIRRTQVQSPGIAPE
jgi:hypothetical protein